MTTIADTGIPVVALHRLVLGVEPIDSISRSRVTAVRVLEELPGDPRRARSGGDPFVERALVRPFESTGAGRFKLRLSGAVRRRFTIRVVDPSRRFVPRRFAVEVWGVPEAGQPLAPAEDLSAVDVVPPAGPFITVESRVLRPWLLPGAGSSFPRGSMGIRGQVHRSDRPVRWVRVEAVRPGTGQVVGRAHGDERGEFVLLVPATREVWPPTGDAFPVELRLFAAPASLRPPTPAEVERLERDRLDDLPVELVPRSSNPPAPGDLDSRLLRGEAIPPWFVEAAAPRPVEQLEIGRLSTPSQPYEFVTP